MEGSGTIRAGLGQSLASMDGSDKRSRLSVLITATTGWPLSARLAIRFIQHRCSVAALCHRGDPLNRVSGIGPLYRYRAFDSGQLLARAIADLRPDLIIPCDDRAVWQLHEAFERYPSFRPLIEASLGDASAYESIRSRVDFMRVARELGLRSPDTCRVVSAADVAAWQITASRPAVVKLDGTWGGAGVRIVTSTEEAVSSMGALLRPQRPGTAWKRYLVNGDPLAFWERKSASRPVVSLQRFIPGRPANAMLACWQGELLGLVAVEVIASQGPTGAATIVRLIDHPEITEAARRVTARLRLSGFHGLDFILEEATGSAFLIELNPRCTQLGHLILPAQGDLAGILCRGLGLQTAPLPEREIDGDLVGFFPQAAAWNPYNPYLKLAQHDIPWSEPALIHDSPVMVRSALGDAAVPPAARSQPGKVPGLAPGPPGRGLDATSLRSRRRPITARVAEQAESSATD
jgi:hypothetical protein